MLVCKQIGWEVTSVDPVFIEEWTKEEAMEQQFVEAQIVQTDAREENVVEVKV
jgi:hypothetical protein